MKLKYLAHYPEAVQAQVRELLAQDRVGELLLRKYPAAHTVRTDRALYEYVTGLKGEFLRSSEPLSKVAYDNQLHVIRNALGTHSTVSRVQGAKLKAKRRGSWGGSAASEQRRMDLLPAGEAPSWDALMGEPRYMQALDLLP